MHKPKKKISLDSICEYVPKIKAINPRFKFGFSYVITWKGSTIHDSSIIENLDEMVIAAQRAQRYGFDYIAFKPFLTRSLINHAEVVGIKESQNHFEEIIARIQRQVEEARKFETPTFRVYATTNLKVLINKSAHTYMVQPKHCHMQFFRQVLSPLGLFNCPAYRNQPHGRLGDKDAYASFENFEKTLLQTAHFLQSFNAYQECKEVTCLYNHANWSIEQMISHQERLDSIQEYESEPDYFL